MGLENGQSLGSYVIDSPLGAGGMGEVYRARDTKLDRDVAVKVLPESLSTDPDALARFEREAKAVAALSHPNILQIHDFGREGDTVYAVTELLDGETMRERLEAGPIPPRKAAEMARQLALGLGAAHEKEVVHRDLKPENLFITRDGRVKILDFGLARVARTPTDVDSTNTPTRTELTSPGTVMGTVGYMSPEQVRGQPAGARSDIFSLGLVLYEMLSGRRAFSRDTAAETMTAILHEEPPEAPLTAGEISPTLHRIVQHCIEKQPEERFRSAHDLAFALESVARYSTTSAPALPPVEGRSPRGLLPKIAAAVALLLVGGLIGFGISGGFREPTEPEPVRFRSITFSGKDTQPAVSPDGRLIAFTSNRDGKSRIWLKQVADGSEVALTEGVDHTPRFSPDGSSVIFVGMRADGPSIFRIAVVGGHPRKVIDSAHQADISPDGETIAFVRRAESIGSLILGLANADGSDERELKTFENRSLFWLRWTGKDQLSFSECQGRSSGYWAWASLLGSAACELVLVDVETGERSILVENRQNISSLCWTDRENEVVYALSEQGVVGSATVEWKFLRQDLRSGDTQTLFWTENLRGSVEILEPGTLLFTEGTRTHNLREFELQDGVAVGRGTPITRGGSMDRQPVYAPDGEFVVFSSNRSGNLDLWAASTTTGEIRRLTDDAAGDWDPGLSADGRQVIWSRDRGGHKEIWMADIDGSGARQVTQDGADAENPTMTPDGEWIVYSSGHLEKLGVWKIRPDGSDATQIVDGVVHIPEVSSDGRYALYGGSDTLNLRASVRVVEIETGREVPFEINVPIPDGGPGFALARGRWMPDGKSIVWLGASEDGRVGLYAQDFVPGRDTTATRRRVAGFDAELVAESFGISPAGERVILSMSDATSRLVVARGVPDIAPARRER